MSDPTTSAPFVSCGFIRVCRVVDGGGVTPWTATEFLRGETRIKTWGAAALGLDAGSGRRVRFCVVGGESWSADGLLSPNGTPEFYLEWTDALVKWEAEGPECWADARKQNHVHLQLVSNRLGRWRMGNLPPHCPGRGDFDWDDLKLAVRARRAACDTDYVSIAKVSKGTVTYRTI